MMNYFLGMALDGQDAVFRSVDFTPDIQIHILGNSDVNEGFLREMLAFLTDTPLMLDVLTHPEVTLDELTTRLGGAVDPRLAERAMTDARYEGYVARQRAEIRRQSQAEGRRIPAWLDYRAVSGLRAEAADVLDRFRPATLGQAGRLAGVNPADLTLLSVAIRRGRVTAEAS